jgi:hypothetical protein
VDPAVVASACCVRQLERSYIVKIVYYDSACGSLLAVVAAAGLPACLACLASDDRVASSV